MGNASPIGMEIGGLSPVGMDFRGPGRAARMPTPAYDSEYEMKNIKLDIFVQKN